MYNINSHDEWGQLKEVIVGVVTNAAFPNDDLGIKLNIAFDTGQLPDTNIPVNGLTQKIIDETNEDLEIFVDALKRLGITVRRPNPIDTSKRITTPDWQTSQYFNYCPRDTLLIVGDTIIETPNVYRSRHFENLSYRDMFNGFLRQGCKWVCAPKPRLRNTDYLNDAPTATILSENDPIFEAANVLKAGKDVFYLVSNGGNELGLTWLQNLLGSDYRIHACRNLYDGIHIDTTLALLRPGLVLANPERVNKDNLPAPLRQWEVIYTPDMREHDYSGLPPTSSKWIGMNLLMINPNLAVVDADQPALVRLLAKHGIDALPLKLRHARVLDGGFRCTTLELHREGNKAVYFDVP
jgi:glycine amidinotransferase/scyllo-inosamine-4-phosphate amidinotransferase 1